MLDFLGSFLLNPWMMAGMAALAIPPIIHLLNRRRYDVVDWGAMQFLQVSEVTRRRIFLEELLLMLLRMGLIAVLVLALAGPFFTSATLARLGARANRDVVLVFDGSYSMGSTGRGQTPFEAAREWALAFVNDLAPGDTVAVLQAKDVVVPVLPEPSTDLGRVREVIGRLPAPSGSCDWRPAVKAAHGLLASSQRAEREIVLLGDGQRYGWADKDSLFRWELLASELGYTSPEVPGANPRPRLWVVNVAPDRSPDPPNWALAPLASNRPIVPVGREVSFRTAMDLRGQPAYSPPYKIRLEIDGKWVRDLPAPASARPDNGKVPFSFAHRFSAPGSHLVSVVLEPDPPVEARPAGYKPKDVLPGDNRQDFAVEVVQALPVLLVDGESSAEAKTRLARGGPQLRGTDFLRDALAPARERSPVVRPRVVPVDQFDPLLLTAPGGKNGDAAAGSRPRVLALCNVPRLSEPQQEAVAAFLADGGGVLVTLGDRVQADAYNGPLYRNGKGWLPARLEGIEGNEARPEDAVRPAPGGSDHPALELFLEKPAGERGPGRFPQLGQARFPRWWKLATPGRNTGGVTVALLRSATAEYPFLVESVEPDRAGRVLQAAVPFDNSWGTNLPNLPAFVPLVHEMVYYLAGARSAEYNLEPGQPLRYRMESGDSLEGYTLQPPGGEARPLSTNPAEPGTYPAQVDRQPQGAVLRVDGTRETGVYRLRTPAGAVVHYVVRPRGAEESDLTPAGEEDRERVARIFPNLKYQNNRGELAEAWVSERHRQEVWWWLLLGLVGLLCGEVWMTRRMVKRR
jgi:hypothetical protein